MIFFHLKAHSSNLLTVVSRPTESPLHYISLSDIANWGCGLSDKVGQDRLGLSVSLLFTGLLVLIMSYKYMTHTHTSLLMIERCLFPSLSFICTHTHRGMSYMWFSLRWCHFTNIQCCMLVKIVEIKLQEVLNVVHMQKDLSLARLYILIFIFCSSAQTLNSSCLLPWNSNSWWTLVDCRVKLQTGLLISEALQKCPFTNINYDSWIDGSITECFFFFGPSFIVVTWWSLYGWVFRLWNTDFQLVEHWWRVVTFWISVVTDGSRSGLVWSHWVRMELVGSLWMEWKRHLYGSEALSPLDNTKHQESTVQQTVRNPTTWRVGI